MIVRHPTFADKIPEELEIGCDPKALTPELVWLAVDGMKIAGILLAFASHGMFYPFRLCVAKGSPALTSLILWRGALREMRGRGYNYFLTVFANDSVAARNVIRLLESRGDTFGMDGDAVWIGGLIDDQLHPKSPRHVRGVRKVANG